MSEFELPQSGTKKSTPRINMNQEPKPRESTHPEPDPEIKADSKEIKEKEYSQEELLQIFDDILFQNEYSETIIIRGRLKTKFRTRTAKEIQAINSSIDAMGASLIQTVEGARSFMHLQRALVEYQGKDLSALKEADRNSFIEALPGPVVGALLMALTKFDNKVAAACQVGEENF